MKTTVGWTSGVPSPPTAPGCASVGYPVGWALHNEPSLRSYQRALMGEALPHQKRGRMTASTQPPLIPDGLHTPPHGEQERYMVEGRRIGGNSACTIIAIRDRHHHGWVPYPPGKAGLGLLFADEATPSLADLIGGRS